MMKSLSDLAVGQSWWVFKDGFPEYWIAIFGETDSYFKVLTIAGREPGKKQMIEKEKLLIWIDRLSLEKSFLELDE